MKFSLSGCFGCLFLSLSIGWSQNFPVGKYDPEKLVDEIFSLQDADLNYEDLYENLMQQLAHPIDLNQATSEELSNLFVLTEMQIGELTAYRTKFGKLLSVYELQAIPSFDLTTIYKLIPFVTVTPRLTGRSLAGRIFHEENNYMVTRFERTFESKKGYATETDSASRYVGGPFKLYHRFRVSHPGDFSLGFTLEKDAGEKMTLNNHQPYYDQYAAHFQVMNQRMLKNLILGDYQAQFGQGLVLGGGFGMGKGAETITTIRRSTPGFLPYTSSGEVGYMRGVAFTLQLNKYFRLHGFASSFRRDAPLKTDSLVTFISSFQSTGYHRTPAEVAARKQVLEYNYGGVFEFKKDHLSAGVILHTTQFDVPLIRSPSLYNQSAFTGKENVNTSLFANYTLKNFSFFGEMAQTMHHGSGLVAGALVGLTRQFDMALHYRNYARDFYSLYGNALSENTTPQNESGIYWGWKYAISSRYLISGYTDLFYFPWLRFRGYSPSAGSEAFIRFTWKPVKTSELFIQMRDERKARNIVSEYPLYQTGEGIRQNWTLNAGYTLGRLNFKTRFQYSSYRLPGSSSSHGMVILQDVTFDAGKILLSARYALFDTDNYDNRQYVYERDVWLAFSLPAYDGQGARSYLLVQYQLTRKLDLWLRLARMNLPEATELGSAGEKISGNVRHDLKLQIRIRL